MDTEIIVGIDEAGRGPWAGPVYAAAVILNPEKLITGLMDSKKLSEKKREMLCPIIESTALAWAVGFATVAEIDALNILQASFLAMQRAVQQLKIKPTFALVDGHLLPELNMKAKAIIDGDELEPAISAASILAKVYRDREMIALDAKYPQYGFAQHKGYGTANHQKALASFGVSDIHRRSFAPVKKILNTKCMQAEVE